MMKTKFLIITFLFTVVNGFSQTEADTTVELTLEQACTLALQRNKNVLNAELDVIKAKKKIWETTAIGLPQVSATFSHNYNIDLPVTLIPARMFNPQAPPGTYMEMRFGTEHNTKFGLTVSQLIFNGQYLVGLQTTKVFKQLSETKLKQTERDIKHSVAETYYLVLITKENLKIIDSNYVFVKKLYDDTKKLYETGMVELTNLKQMELNLEQMKNAKTTISRQLEVAKNLLKFQIGLDLSVKVKLTDDINTIEKEIEPAVSLIDANVAPEENLDYRLLETQEKLQTLAVKNEKAALLPAVSVFYNHQESQMGDKIQWFDDDSKWYHANIVGLNVNIHIFGSGQKLARISQAKIERDKITNQKLMLKQSITMKILQAKVNLQNSIDSYNSQKKNKDLAEYIYNSTKEKYLKGISSSMELTQAQMQYFSALQQYYQSVMDFLKAKNELEKLMNK